MMVQTYNPRTQEVNAGEPEIEGHPRLYSEFDLSLG